MTKTTKYIVGHTYSVALNTIQLPEERLTSRYSLGNNFLSVKADIERQGQAVPCFAQLLNEEQLKAYPGKLFMLLDGVTGRFKIAELLGRELLIQLVEPRTEAGMLELAITSNGPRSQMSAMDISVAATRQEAMGFSVERACINLSWVAGKGKPLGIQRYWQYKRLQNLPAEIQKMVHLGNSTGGIQLNAALHMTNAKRSTEQWTATIEAAKDRRRRLLAEEWDENKRYIDRELKDAVLKEAMGQELGERPPYTPKKKAKAVDDAMTTPEIVDADAVVMGISDKTDPRPDVNKPAPTGVGPLTHSEFIDSVGKLRERGGVLIEVANCLQGLVNRDLTSQEFCDVMEAMFANGKGKAKVIRRTIAEKLAKALDVTAVPSKAVEQPVDGKVTATT